MDRAYVENLFNNFEKKYNKIKKSSSSKEELVTSFLKPKKIVLSDKKPKKVVDITERIIEKQQTVLVTENKEHTHPEYEDHKHRDYSKVGHEHLDYSRTSHEHDEYSYKNHEHKEITQLDSRVNTLQTETSRIKQEVKSKSNKKHADNHIKGGDVLPVVTEERRGLMAPWMLKLLKEPKTVHEIHGGGGAAVTGTGTGTSNSEKYTFTNADLTGTQLIKPHTLNDTCLLATITDSSGKTVQVAWVDSSDATKVTVELKGTSIAYGDDGTWTLRLGA